MEHAWDTITHLRRDRTAHLLEFYRNQRFRPEFRILLGRWMERNITLLEVMQQNAQEDKARIMVLYSRFLREMEKVRDLSLRARQLVQEGILYYRAEGPESWYNTISACLTEEMTQISADMGDQVPSSDFRIFCFSTYVRLVSRELPPVLLDIHQTVILNTERQTAGLARPPELDERNNACVTVLDEFTRKFERVRDKVENFMIPLKWSAYGSYGFTMLVPNLEEVQRWYQILINTIHEFHENLGRVSAYINVQAIVNRVRTCYLALLSHALAVDTQQPQVILKGRRLPHDKPLSVRCLLRLPGQADPEVKSTIIDENQARALWPATNLGSRIPSSGTISSPEGSIPENTTELVYEFRNLTVTSVQRPTTGRHPTDPFHQQVFSRKFCFLFHADLNVLGGTARFWCCSQPFVFIVHGKQEETANAIAFWDRFHSNERKPFQTEEDVPWGIVSAALNSTFRHISHTSRTFSRKNLEYVGERLLDRIPTDQCMVSATRLLASTARKDIFWSWFCKAADLVKPDPGPQEAETERNRRIYLHGPWNDGYMIGFISRKETEQVLLSKNQLGACVFRFSDSVSGAISFSYLRSSEGENRVTHVAPFTRDALLSRSMEERLTNELQEYTYPCICYEDNAQPDGFNLALLQGIFTTMPESIRVPEGYTPPRVFRTVYPRPVPNGDGGMNENNQEGGLVGNYQERGLVENYQERGLVENYQERGLVENYQERGLVENYQESGMVQNNVEGVQRQNNPGIVFAVNNGDSGWNVNEGVMPMEVPESILSQWDNMRLDDNFIYGILSDDFGRDVP